MLTTTSILTSFAPFMEAVVHNTQDDFVWVHTDAHDELIPCKLLQTSAENPLLFENGDGALVLFNPEQEFGYILGKVRTPSMLKPTETRKPFSIQDLNHKRILLNGEEIEIKAEQKIRLECGQSSLEMDHEGQITLRGVDITTRAKRNNKIRGGQIALN